MTHALWHYEQARKWRDAQKVLLTGDPLAKTGTSRREVYARLCRQARIHGGLDRHGVEQALTLLTELCDEMPAIAVLEAAHKRIQGGDPHAALAAAQAERLKTRLFVAAPTDGEDIHDLFGEHALVDPVAGFRDEGTQVVGEALEKLHRQPKGAQPQGAGALAALNIKCEPKPQVRIDPALHLDQGQIVVGLRIGRVRVTIAAKDRDLGPADRGIGPRKTAWRRFEAHLTSLFKGRNRRANPDSGRST